ncbi:hypothetical protein KIPB_017117, partial [Kipferlia bialata]
QSCFRSLQSEREYYEARDQHDRAMSETRAVSSAPPSHLFQRPEMPGVDLTGSGGPVEAWFHLQNVTGLPHPTLPATASDDEVLSFLRSYDTYLQQGGTRTAFQCGGEALVQVGMGCGVLRESITNKETEAEALQQIYRTISPDKVSSVLIRLSSLRQGKRPLRQYIAE